MLLPAYPREWESWGHLEQDLAPSKYIINRIRMMMMMMMVMMVMPVIAHIIFSVMGHWSRDSHP